MRQGDIEGGRYRWGERGIENVKEREMETEEG